MSLTLIAHFPLIVVKKTMNLNVRMFVKNMEISAVQTPIARPPIMKPYASVGQDTKEMLRMSLLAADLRWLNAKTTKPALEELTVLVAFADLLAKVTTSVAYWNPVSKDNAQICVTSKILVV